jgi:pimeloyl-ACP methyl ester carboxylesterase
MSRRINEHTKQKIYILDMRNHGASIPYTDKMSYLDMAADLKLFIENIVLEKDKCNFVTLMGHSMGIIRLFKFLSFKSSSYV